jgi:hypothetical protein
MALKYARPAVPEGAFTSNAKRATLMMSRFSSRPVQRPVQPLLSVRSLTLGLVIGAVEPARA